MVKPCGNTGRVYQICTWGRACCSSFSALLLSAIEAASATAAPSISKSRWVRL